MRVALFAIFSAVLWASSPASAVTNGLFDTAEPSNVIVTPLGPPATPNCAADGPGCEQFAPDRPEGPPAVVPVPPAIVMLLAGIAALAGLARGRRAG